MTESTFSVLSKLSLLMFRYLLANEFFMVYGMPVLVNLDTCLYSCSCYKSTFWSLIPIEFALVSANYCCFCEFSVLSNSSDSVLSLLSWVVGIVPSINRERLSDEYTSWLVSCIVVNLCVTAGKGLAERPFSSIVCCLLPLLSETTIGIRSTGLSLVWGKKP